MIELTEDFIDDNNDKNKLDDISTVSDTNDNKSNMINDISIVSDDNYDDNKENNGKRQRVVGTWSNVKVYILYYYSLFLII